MNDGLTLDQIQLLLTVAEEGSFSGAARKLRRAQSAVTYGVQKLERQIGVALFDRSEYRPVLTEAGRALLARARRIAEETAAFRDQARSLAGGLESELTLVLDSMFPMPRMVDALRAFTDAFPTVTPRIFVQSLGASAELVLNGTCMIGLVPEPFSDQPALKRYPLSTVQLLPVVAQHHPLAAIEGPIPTDVLRRYVQLVLTDRSALTEGRDYGVLSTQTWRLADLGTKHAMLLAGLGWGSMPTHLVADDVEAGRLKLIQPLEFEDRTARLVMTAAHLAARPLGPAAQWLLTYLRAQSPASEEPRAQLLPDAAKVRSGDSSAS